MLGERVECGSSIHLHAGISECGAELTCSSRPAIFIVSNQPAKLRGGTEHLPPSSPPLTAGVLGFCNVQRSGQLNIR